MTKEQVTFSYKPPNKLVDWYYYRLRESILVVDSASNSETHSKTFALSK